MVCFFCIFKLSIDLAIFQISLINLVMIITVKIQDCDTSTHTSELYLDHLKAINTDSSLISLYYHKWYSFTAHVITLQHQ